MVTLDRRIRHLNEPIHEWILYRNRVRLWAAKNSLTMLFLAIFGWLSILTLVVIYNG